MSPRFVLMFVYLGFVSFGGGLAIVPEMHRQIVDAHWLSEGEFADGYAIGQIAPGPNMLSIVFYGYRIAGPLGALVATLGTFGPGVVASAAIGRFMTTHASNRVISRLRRGLVPVGVGLMIAGVFVLGRSVVLGPISACLAAVVAVLVAKKWVSPALAVVAAGFVGALAAA